MTHQNEWHIIQMNYISSVMTYHTNEGHIKVNDISYPIGTTYIGTTYTWMTHTWIPYTWITCICDVSCTWIACHIQESHMYESNT